MPELAAASPMNSFQYLFQNDVEDKFMELIPIDEYAAGTRTAPSIDYDDLDDRFLISLVVGTEDMFHPAEQAERIARDLDKASVSFHYEQGFDHNTFGYKANSEWVDRIVKYIENGAEYARK